MNQMQQSVLDIVPHETMVEVEEIVRRLPSLRWRDVFNALHDLRLKGKIVLKQQEGESRVLVMKTQLKENPPQFQLVKHALFTNKVSFGKAELTRS